MTRSTSALTALVAGATGAVGRALVTQLLANTRYTQVKVLSRRPLGIVHAKLEEITLPGADVAALGEALRADDVFCCLGTTLAAAGSRAAFERVDYHLVLDVARAARTQGARQFLVVSAAGSAAKSPSFYSRVKARMEASVSELGYATVHVVRPSLLIAEREERRPGEWLAQKLVPLLNPLLLGKLAIYRAVPAEDVATALIALAARNVPGVHIHHLPLDD